MTWVRKHKILSTLIAVFIILPIAVVSCSSVHIGVESGDVSFYSCERLQREYADALQLTRLSEATDKSFFTFIEEEAKGDMMGRLFVRFLIWSSGGREGAEQATAQGHAMHMAVVKKEIAARCP